jgi:hypothetical protein
MSMPVVFENSVPLVNIAISQTNGKIHSQFPKHKMFRGHYDSETKQLEGEIIDVNPDLKTKFKILKKRNYAAKMLRLKRIHRKLAPKIESLRSFSTLLETF